MTAVICKRQLDSRQTRSDHESILVLSMSVQEQSALNRVTYPLDEEIEELHALHRRLPVLKGFLFTFLLLCRLDETTEHIFLCRLPSFLPGGTMIRASRAYFDGIPYYGQSRLAVLKDLRCHNFGGELVLALHIWAATVSQSRAKHSAKAIRYSRTHDLFVLVR